MSDFLPSDYRIPSAKDGYMSFEQGENRFRVLDKAITGYRWFVTIKDENDKEISKPITVRMETPIKMEEIEEDMPKHIWIMPVYNFGMKRIQVLVITQKGIQKSILAFTKNAKWGSPENYNLVVTKTGEKLLTEYSVMAEPVDKDEEKLLEDIKKQYKAMNMDLTAMYSSEKYPYGGDPYASNNEALVNTELGE